MQPATRRHFLALAIAAGIAPRALAQASRMGTATPFSFEALVAEAARSARGPYVPTQVPQPDVLDAIDYDAHWRLRFRPEKSVMLHGGDTPVQFFHLGRYAREPVTIHVVENGEARELRYDPALFDMPEDSPAHQLTDGAGFAGFRVMRPGNEPDWLSFLGASYFRCDGPEGQYGLSARGLAIDTGLDRAEEFPRFTGFWLGEGERDGEFLTIWARLESPAVAGAYRIGAKPKPEGGHTMTIEARLFLRHAVDRLGIAPLTSMFWYSERDRGDGSDWRPEIHDSDGLALLTGAGERLWRPLGNPARVTMSGFADDNPRGFGLIQRDRDFENYLDDGVWYDRRPSAWVTPLGDWGRGAVRLLEIPTGDETFDNIVAFWEPETLPEPGQEAVFAWRIDWVATDPDHGMGRAVATRTGEGGIPGQPGPEGSVKYVVDFEGGPLADLSREAAVEAHVETTVGKLESVTAYQIVGTNRWRMIFDLEDAQGQAADLRAFLSLDGAPLTETWIALSEPETGSPA